MLTTQQLEYIAKVCCWRRNNFSEGTLCKNKLVVTNSDKGSDVDLSGKEDVGVAEGLIEGHESTYDHDLISTALQSETDPVFGIWDKSTGISITESQISDLQSYLLDISGQDLSTADNSTSKFITIDDVPSALLLDQTTPQAFTNGTVTGSGNLVVVSGVLGLDTETYLDTTTAGNTYARIDGQVFTGNISAPNLSGTNTGDSSGHSGLVPYTGASANVDLGDKSLTASSFMFDSETGWYYDSVNSKINMSLLKGSVGVFGYDYFDIYDAGGGANNFERRLESNYIFGEAYPTINPIRTGFNIGPENYYHYFLMNNISLRSDNTKCF